MGELNPVFNLDLDGNEEPSYIKENIKEKQKNQGVPENQEYKKCEEYLEIIKTGENVEEHIYEESMTEKKAGILSTPEIEPPDGGWGWIIAIASCIIMILAPMPLCVYSVIYSDILMYGNVSSALNTLIFNASLFVSSCSGIFVPSLCTLIGYRKMSLLGTFLCAVGTILSAFVTSSPLYLFLCFSVLYGLGLGICMPIQSFIIPQYFKKKRGLILGVGMSGRAASFFLAPVLIGVLQKMYAYKGSTFLLGAIMLNGLVAGSLYHPVEWHVKPKKKEIVQKKIEEFSGHTKVDEESSTKELDPQRNPNGTSDSEPASKSNPSVFLTKFMKSMHATMLLLKSHRMKIIALVNCLSITAYMNTTIMLPFLMKERGHSLEMSLQLFSVMNASSFAARIFIAIIIDRQPFNPKYFYLFGLFCLPIATFALTLVRGMTLFMVVGSLLGIGHGICVVVLTLVLIEIMDMEFLVPAYSVMICAMGLNNLVMGSLVGVIRDVTGSYFITIQILSGIYLLSFLLCFLMPLAQISDKRRGCAQPSGKNKTCS